ncbi:MAG: BREX-1 system adenine-specific DNA-methyltransferase PglX, partial [Candidatus Humimicrobiaceae bacterium]
WTLRIYTITGLRLMVLVYTTDFSKIPYKNKVFSQFRDKLTLEKNLYGLEIDDRAAQLASFALVMKARSYKKDILDEYINLNILSIQESNNISDLDSSKYPNLYYLTQKFYDAKEYGSIIEIDGFDYASYLKELNILKESQDLFSQDLYEKMLPLVKQAHIMAQKYDCVITNPPYMGSGNMNPRLSEYVQKHYKDSKSDMFAVFMELCIKMARDNGYVGMITQHQWMFKQIFKNLRYKILANLSISSMAHLGPRAFEEIGGEIVQNTMFALIKKNIKKYKPTFIKLLSVNNPKEKENIFLSGNFRFYNFSIQDFLCMPDFLITYYYITRKTREIFIKFKKFSELANLITGLTTGNDDIFIKLWFETNKDNISIFNQKNPIFYPITLGGFNRKWYGNNEFIILWRNNGEEIKNYSSSSSLSGLNLFFKKGITWSKLSMEKLYCRYQPNGYIFKNTSSFIFTELIKYYISFLNTKVSQYLINVIDLSFGFTVGTVGKIPTIIPEDNGILDNINSFATSSIDISKQEWDSREISWDFKTNELIRLKDNSNLIEKSVNNYIEYWTDKFNTLHRNEEDLNKIFIDIYNMADELTPVVDKKDITILKEETTILNDNLTFKKEILIKHLISYAVGTMLGRYSLDTPGISYAGGEFDITRYSSCIPDKDAMTPILQDDYFEDDIVSKFIEFLKVVFSKETLTQNIEYIADTLSKNTNESSTQRIRRYFINEFYKDHLKMYKKRPIYFMFSSGPNKAFNALVYIHRYNRSTIAKLRLDYLHHLISKLDSTEQMLKNDSTTPQVKISKKLAEISKQRQELKKYDELLRHYADKNIEIDLDDGIKINYAKFESLVAEI